MSLALKIYHSVSPIWQYDIGPKIMQNSLIFYSAYCTMLFLSNDIQTNSISFCVFYLAVDPNLFINKLVNSMCAHLQSK